MNLNAVMDRGVDKLKSLFPDKGIIKIVTHIDTDGLSAGAIITKFLQRKDQKFLISAVKQLDNSILDQIEEQASKQKWKALIFLDLGSNKLTRIKKLTKYTTVFIIDHHEIELGFDLASDENQDDGFHFINPLNEEISAAGLCYLFVKKVDKLNELAQFAIIGMIGDFLDRTISKQNNTILADAQESGMQVKKSLTLFSARRPLYKALELSSTTFIPGITGNPNRALAMLREIGIQLKTSKGWRTLVDLTEEELSRLIAAILMKRVNHNYNQDIIGNIYLIKIASQLWDAREISTMLNACGRLGYPDLAIAFLLDSTQAREEIEQVYSKYRQYLIKALNWVKDAKKIQGGKYVIINAKSAIKDTMIGTVTSIIAASFLYPADTILVGMAYRSDDKIKVSARIVKDKVNEKSSINLNKLLGSVIEAVCGEFGGHTNAAGGLITKEKEQAFLELLEKELNMQEIKIKI